MCGLFSFALSLFFYGHMFVWSLFFLLFLFSKNKPFHIFAIKKPLTVLVSGFPATYGILNCSKWKKHGKFAQAKQGGQAGVAGSICQAKI